ncbi:MAG: serine hydrolase domain-containing protein [Saprospiraceae bacterium]|nr:serine hydrolase [Lewinella sp.]
MRAYHYSLLLCLFALPLFSQNDKDYAEAFQLIEVWLDAQKDYEKLPGLTALIVKDQEVLWSGGFGVANEQNGTGATPSTLFSICSISKLFTSVAIMKLYDEGKLRLDDTVDELLPWYNLAQKYPDSGPITIRSLMTHSSGLPRESNHPYWTGPDFPFPTEEAVKEGLKEQETLYPASHYFQYSNLGLTLLGEIVAQVSGRPYEEYVMENILGPLGLENTRTFLPEDEYGHQLAIGYSALDRKGERSPVAFFQAKGITPAAGYSSSVEDLGKFASWQFRLLNSKEPEVLKPATLDYMQRVQWTDPDWSTTWGLGFAVWKGSNNSRIVGHGGSCPGYRSSLSMEPDNKMGYVAMINAGSTNPGKYIEGMKQILDKVKPKKESDGADKAELDLTAYTGYYSVQPWASEEYIGVWQGGLVMLGLPADEPGKAMAFYKHVKGDTFQRIREGRDMSETITFERDAAGKVYRYNSHGNYVHRMDR